MNLRSPLSHVLGSGSAKDGTEHFWGQRLSALALLVLGLWFVIALWRIESLQYLDLIHWLRLPFNSVSLIFLCLTLAYHSKLGIQVIVEDYVGGAFIKVTAIILSNFAHLFVALAAVFSILKIAFGAQE